MAKQVRVGKVPEGGMLLGAFAGSGGWMLFEVPSSVAGGWIGLKLVSMSMRVGRANFRLAWNGRRLSCSSENKSLHDLDPALLDWVVDVMRGLTVRPS